MCLAMRFAQCLSLPGAIARTIGNFAERDYTLNRMGREELVRHLKALLSLPLIALVGVPAAACPTSEKIQTIRSYVPSEIGGGETVRKVMRGDKLAIACDGLDLSSGDVRVVLNVDASGAKKLGYQGVLATDQTQDNGKLQIRVPDAPDLANHTVNVKVFVMNGSSATSCDAGTVRVV
jgi:hypothetical protein